MFARQQLHRERQVHILSACAEPLDIGHNKATSFPMFLMIMGHCKIDQPGTDTMDSLCGLVVRVPGYRKEMYCASCEVRTEFLYVM
jgi:hypothetical protein